MAITQTHPAVKSLKIENSELAMLKFVSIIEKEGPMRNGLIFKSLSPHNNFCETYKSIPRPIEGG